MSGGSASDAGCPDRLPHRLRRTLAAMGVLGCAPQAEAWVSAGDWVRYDLLARRDHSWIPGPTRAPESVEEPSVALCHGDGRVREGALRGGVPDRLLPLVVLCCADWAEPVKEAERTVVELCL